MYIKKYKVNNIPKYITLLCSIFIFILSFVHPILPNYRNGIGNLSCVYISYYTVLIIPILMILNTILDGVLFFRYKFSLIQAYLWIASIYYLHCVLSVDRFGFNSYRIFFFTALIPGIVSIFPPFFIKDGDKTGLTAFSWYDIFWILTSIGLMIFFIILCNTLKNERTVPFEGRRSGKLVIERHDNESEEDLIYWDTYKEIVSLYAEAERNAKNCGDMTKYYNNNELNMKYLLAGDNIGQTCYELIDFDGNGIPELVIADVEGLKYDAVMGCEIYGIFSEKDGIRINMTDFYLGYKGRLYLLEDYRLLEIAGEIASDEYYRYTYCIYEIDGTKLVNKGVYEKENENYSINGRTVSYDEFSANIYRYFPLESPSYAQWKPVSEFSIQN